MAAKNTKPHDQRELSPWAERIIDRITLMLKKGHFVMVRKLVDELESNGLQYDDRDYCVSLETSLSDIFELKLVNKLEKHLGVFTVSDLLSVDVSRLKDTPGIGEHTLTNLTAFISRTKGQLGFFIHLDK